MSVAAYYAAAAERHAKAVSDCLAESRRQVARGRRGLAFWLLDMAALNRRHYIADRAALKRAWREQ